MPFHLDWFVLFGAAMCYFVRKKRPKMKLVLVNFKALLFFVMFSFSKPISHASTLPTSTFSAFLKWFDSAHVLLRSNKLLRLNRSWGSCHMHVLLSSSTKFIFTLLFLQNRVSAKVWHVSWIWEQSQKTLKCFIGTVSTGSCNYNTRKEEVRWQGFGATKSRQGGNWERLMGLLQP